MLITSKPKLICILKKKKNNFFATLMDLKTGLVIYNKSCGSIAGMRGSKRFTTVALELLGKEIFLRLYASNLKYLPLHLILRFKVDKFVRAFVRGFLLYGKKYIKLKISSEFSLSHNDGMRSKKKRRV